MHGPVFLSVGPEAKLDMYNNFDLDKPFDLHLDPPSSEDPPLCRIIQKGKDSVLTTDFYLTNIEPKPWILPTHPSNKGTPKPSGATTADKFTPVIEQDPVQPREIRLHSWMLYTPQVPVLNFRGETITSTLDLSDSDTSEEELVNPMLRTSEEERYYGTICGSALATQVALSHSRTQTNPTVKRGPNHKVRSYLMVRLKINKRKLQKNKNKVICDMFI